MTPSPVVGKVPAVGPGATIPRWISRAAAGAMLLLPAARGGAIVAAWDRLPLDGAAVPLAAADASWLVAGAAFGAW